MASKHQVDRKKTFVKQIDKTIYQYVLDVKLKYEVYVHRAGASGNFHDKIVLKADYRQLDLGYITLELGKTDDYSRVTAKSMAMFRLAEEDKKKLIFKGTIAGRLTDIAKFAMAILIDMQSYNLLGNNCQNFCNYFLERLGMPPYHTTVKQGAGVLIGILVAGFLIWWFAAPAGKKTAK